MKNLLIALTILFSSTINAQLLDDGTGYNQWMEINGNTLQGQAAGTLTTVYQIPNISKRTLETISLACSYCISNSEISNNYLRINADAQGKNLFNSTALVYENIPWPSTSVVNGIVLTTTSTTSFIETTNTQVPYVLGARIRAVIYTTNGTVYTPFVSLKPNARNIIPVTPGQIKPIKIRIEFWNLNKINTQFKVETIDLSVPNNTCSQ